MQTQKILLSADSYAMPIIAPCLRSPKSKSVENPGLTNISWMGNESFSSLTIFFGIATTESQQWHDVYFCIWIYPNDAIQLEWITMSLKVQFHHTSVMFCMSFWLSMRFVSILIRNHIWSHLYSFLPILLLQLCMSFDICSWWCRTYIRLCRFGASKVW